MKTFFNISVGSKLWAPEDFESYLVEAETFVEAAIRGQDFVDALNAALGRKFPKKWREDDAFLQCVFRGTGQTLATPEAVEEFVSLAEYEFD